MCDCVWDSSHIFLLLLTKHDSFKGCTQAWSLGLLIPSIPNTLPMYIPSNIGLKLPNISAFLLCIVSAYFTPQYYYQPLQSH